MKIKTFFNRKIEDTTPNNEELLEERLSEEKDDLGILDYFLDDVEHISIGTYQVVWSESDLFDTFDMIDIEEITSTSLVIIHNNKRKEYKFSQLKGIEVTKDEDYNKLFQ